MKQEDLLSHAEFIQSLARSLVKDEHQAADMAQTAWVAALEHPPASGGSVRSWFARVLRNFAVTAHRTETRRRRHEMEAARTGAMTSPEEIAMRREALRSMTEAVLTLEEPYLSTILLRFYEDLPAREVAKRLGIPHETAKTRIQRGLERLRKKLDDAYGGDRLLWSLAIAPLAGLKLVPLSVASAASATAAVTASSAPAGAALSEETAGSLLSWTAKILAPTGVKFFLAAAIMVGSGAALFHFLPGPQGENPASSGAGIAPAGSVLAGKGARLPPAGGEGKEWNSQYSGEGDERETIAPPGVFIEGRVTDGRTGKPVTSYDFRLQRFDRDVYEKKTVIHETVRDAEGRFRFRLERGGVFSLAVWSSRHTMRRIRRLAVSGEKGRKDLEITLDPGLTVSGRVVEDSTGRPVEGAVVGPAVYSTELDLASLEYLDFDEVCIHDRTGPDGRFTIRGLRGIDRRIAAVHPDFAEGFVKTDPEKGEAVTIRLKRGATIFGKAFDDEGKPAAGLLIRLFGDALPAARPVITGADGTFRTRPVAPGRVILKAGGAPDELDKGIPFTEEYKIVEVRDSDVEVDFGTDRDRITWRGALVGYDGKPVPGGIVFASPALFSPWEARDFHLARAIPCDGAGRFAVAKLHPGRYRVQVVLPGRRLPIEWKTIALDAPGTVEKNIDLSRTSSLSGLVINDLTGGPFPSGRGFVHAWQNTGSRNNYYAPMNRDGTFTIKGLEGGSYFLQAKVGDLVSEPLIGIKVEQSLPVSGLVIPVSPVGTLRFRIEGCRNAAGEGASSFSLALSQGEKDRELYLGKHRLDASGSFEETFRLKTGTWTAALSIDGRGFVQRDFEILPEETTDLVVDGLDVLPFEGSLTLAGNLRRADGSPSKNMKLFFRALSVPGLPPDRKRLEVTTDVVGNYVLPGLKPGRWCVTARPAEGVKVAFPPLWIPPDAPDPLIHDMTLPGGTVAGELVDGSTGLPFSADHPGTWKVYLHDVERDRYVSSCAKGEENGRFQLPCDAEGRFQILVVAEGYEYYESGAFSLNQGRNLYLGDIALTPCGLLDLEVVDAASMPVKAFSITCDGMKIEPVRPTKKGFLYDRLPTGPVTFVVGAEGFLEQDATVTLEPARPVEARIVLRPVPVENR